MTEFERINPTREKSLRAHFHCAPMNDVFVPEIRKPINLSPHLGSFFFLLLHTSSETRPQMNRDTLYVDILNNRGRDKPHPWQMLTLNMLDLIQRNHKLSVNE